MAGCCPPTAVPGARGGGLCAASCGGAPARKDPRTRVGGGTLPSPRLAGPCAGGGTLPSPRRLPGARGGGFCASVFVGARLLGSSAGYVALPHLRMELERAGAGCRASAESSCVGGDRNEFGRLAELAEPICRTLSGGWSGSRTVLVSGRPGWWSRALCRFRARGKSNGRAAGRLGGRAGGPEAGCSRPQALARPPGLFKRRPPSPPAGGPRAGGSRLRSASGVKLRGGKLAGPTMATARVAPVGGAGGRVVGRAGASLGGARQLAGLPIKWVGGRGIGWARRRTGGRLLTAVGFGAAARPCRMEAPNAKRLSAERVGAVRRSAPRGADLRGGKLRGPRWLTARVAPVGGAGGRIGGPSRSFSGRARTLAGLPHQMGGRPGNWVGAPEDRRTAVRGRRLRGGHPAFSEDGRRHRPPMGLARVGQVAERQRSQAASVEIEMDSAGWWSLRSQAAGPCLVGGAGRALCS